MEGPSTSWPTPPSPRCWESVKWAYRRNETWSKCHSAASEGCSSAYSNETTARAHLVVRSDEGRSRVRYYATTIVVGVIRSARSSIVDPTARRASGLWFLALDGFECLHRRAPGPDRSEALGSLCARGGIVGASILDGSMSESNRSMVESAYLASYDILRQLP